MGLVVFAVFVAVMMIKSIVCWQTYRPSLALQAYKGMTKLSFFSSPLTSTRVPLTLSEKVKLVSGEEGTVKTIGRAGWYSIQLTKNNVIIKVRRSDILATLGPAINAVAEANEIFPPLTVLAPNSPHDSFNSWVIFSDLHVKASSVSTCEKVLEEVHAHAVSRNAGIIFLGDFWHVRGALSVDLLNRVLKKLRQWTQPVIMIPGNHDQVTLGGKIHALEPLKYAFKDGNILMIDEPSICLNALWLPYRRNHNLMKYILNEAWNHPEVSAIFCHADVKGAWMNDGITSREGLDVQCFPPNIPIFSGHFHKPHSVSYGSQSLRYVGSPYQTSASEADQIKYLYEVSLLNSDSFPNKQFWKETDRWPIQIGKRYFKMNFSPNWNSKLQFVKSGDTVILKTDAINQRAADAIARNLRNEDIEVEVVQVQKDGLFIKSLLEDATGMHHPSGVASESEVVDMMQAATNIGSTNQTLAVTDTWENALLLELDRISPVSLFEKYIQSMELNQFIKAENKSLETFQLNQNYAESMKLIVLEEGKKVIEQLQHKKSTSEHAGGGGETLATLNSDHRYLHLDTISLRNFGPYGGNPITYPLSKRGLVLLRGETVDNAGADSNGSGKTTLAMSILWALTGSMDTRLTNEGRNMDVAFDAPSSTGACAETRRSSQLRRTAEVSLKGRINGKPFEIVRRKSSKKQELFFYVDNQDMTNQAVKDTQAVLDAWLGLNRGVLQRCFFFGQHSHTAQSLLGLTDTKMKEELGSLINIDIWIASAAEIKNRDKIIKSEIAELNTTLKYLTQQELPRLQEQVQIQERFQQQLSNDLQQLLSRRTSESNQLIINNVDLEGNNEILAASTLYSQIELLEAVITQLETQRVGISNGRLDTLRKELLSTINSQARLTTTKALRDNKPSSLSLLEKQRSKVSRNSLALESLDETIQQLQERLKVEFPLLKAQLEKKMKNLTESNPLLEYEIQRLHNTDGIVLENGFREKLDSSIASLAALDEQIRTINGTLQRLTIPADSILSPPHHHSSIADNDKCPTCNQTFPSESRATRQLMLRTELQSLLQSRSHSLSTQRQLQEQLEASKVWIELDKKRKEKLQEEEQLRVHLTALLDERKHLAAESLQVQKELEHAQLEDQQITLKFQSRVDQLQKEIVTEEESLRKIDTEVRIKKDQLAKLKRSYDKWKEQEGKFNVSFSLLEEKLRLANQTLLDHSELLKKAKNSIVSLEAQRDALFHQQTVFSYLLDFFGTKGIQHFIFQSVIERLELLANSYLDILTSGGIRLQLRSDLDGEKILKYVMIRRSGEESLTEEDEDSLSRNENSKQKDYSPEETPVGLSGFHERGLAQLSGGQWRRVSLALDFAFTELVIRRGILKCNVLVLDEILTHLDGQGREAVGTVLKAMVDRTTSEQPQTHSFGGGFETIIVILQDLVANEIEEAFDHIDVVRKEGDVSKVFIDK